MDLELEDSSPQQAEPDLAVFREKWKEELQNKLDNEDENNVKVECEKQDLASEVEDDFVKARDLFLEASEQEKNGKVFEAMTLYRKATHLVPNIEFRMYEMQKKQTIEEAENLSFTSLAVDGDNNDDDEDLDNVDLYTRFLHSIQVSGRLLENQEPIERVQISDLPIELIMIIIRWIVGNDLDVRSLGRCAAVSKGFYICSRHPEIWRMICLKIWGANLGTLKASSFTSFREMFFERTRVNFHGCYISRTTYFRYGENSFQDQFYKPVHHVEYYRYMRFFPDGIVLMLTTADEPMITLKKLKNRDPKRNEILKGFYRMHGDALSIILKRNVKTQISYNPGNKKRNDYEISQQTFHIEMKIAGSARRKFNQLQWRQYSIIQKRKQDEVTTDFEVTGHMYPSFWFSRVESYNVESDSILHITSNC